MSNSSQWLPGSRWASTVPQPQVPLGGGDLLDTMDAFLGPFPAPSCWNLWCHMSTFKQLLAFEEQEEGRGRGRREESGGKRREKRKQRWTPVCVMPTAAAQKLLDTCLHLPLVKEPLGVCDTE